MPLELKTMDSSSLILDREWVIQISRVLEEGTEENDDGVPVRIFSVPKTLLSLKPEAYTPQLVAFGPYHHLRPDLLEMEHYKLETAKTAQKNLREGKFSDLVNRIAECDSTFRAYYHRFLEFDQETLAWIFAIDASFLLEYLQAYSARIEGSLTQVSSKMAHLIDYTRRKTAHRAILRDIIMLENQIPLFLLRKVHSFYQCEDHDKVFVTMLMGFCRDISPIKNMDYQHFSEECSSRAHLLELLYCMVAPKLQPVACCEQKEPKEDEDVGQFIKALKSFMTTVCQINSATIHLLSKMCKSKVAKLLLTVPFAIISCLFRLKNKNALDSLMTTAENVAEEVESASQKMEHDSPLVEEIAIPSVSDLHKIGVKFRPSKGGLGSINFDKASGTFYLPVIHLDSDSEIVLRNLVAYEACVAPEVMVFTRYAELMNGVIDTKEDVRILREAGIILNRLKSDEEVAELWNGMTKSVIVTKVPILDKAIESVNSYYSRSWKVRIRKTMKIYFFSSLPFLALLATGLLILLSAVQTACSVYDCSKWFTTS